MKTSIGYILIFTMLAVISFGFIWYQLKQVEVSPIQFSITLSANKGDFLNLFYRSKNENFSKDKKVKRRIVGDGVLQSFDYNLPDGTHTVRIDLGQNQNQKQLIINNISIEDTKGNSKIVKEKLLRQLRFNKYCHNFEETEQGLKFNTKVIRSNYHPQIEDLNIPYLLYYSR